MSTISDIIASNRERVLHAYQSAICINRNLFLKGDVRATSEYIYENQIIDGNEIVREMYENSRRVISIVKKTKVGMDGLMIEIAKLMTTHPDDSFVMDPDNVRFLTGMSNAGWEKDMKDKTPECFKDKIFHHGQLKKADLKDLKNALIFIDELDVADKEFQVLHATLTSAGVLDVKHLEENNIRFVFASATMVKELYDLSRWGALHKTYHMTIPPNYIGHIDFLRLGIIREYYSMNSAEAAEKWIREDILEHYGADFRVHIARVNTKSVIAIQEECKRKAVRCINHTTKDKLTPEEINELFNEPLKSHIVLAIKGFFRRANLIPNKWKLRIGATHELYTKNVDNNVQIQGLPGRMSGYWRTIVEGGHKTGPYRTSVKAVEEYEKIFNDPFGVNSYQTAGFKKKKGKVVAEPTMVSPQNIAGLVALPVPTVDNGDPAPVAHPVSFKTLSEALEFLKEKLGREITAKFYKKGGYELSTRLNSYYGKKKNELLASDRLTIEKYNSIAIGLNLSKTGKGQNYMIYPVYHTMESSEVSYYVRYLQAST